MSDLVYDLPIGSRVMKRGFGVSVLSGDRSWWCYDRRIWTSLDDNKAGLSSSAPCRTVKAFKRHLRKHAEALSGREVVWVGMFMTVTRPATTPEDGGA